MEQAPKTPSRGNTGSRPRIGLPRRTFDSANDINAEKVLVFSFRNLQLKRIAELQDRLIGLSMDTFSSQDLAPDHISNVDQALGEYAQALRNYETLSFNTLPSIPIGARLIGSMGTIIGEEPDKSFLKQVWKIVKLVAATASIIPKLETPLDAATAAAEVMRGAEGHGEVTPSSAIEFIERSCGDLGFRELDRQGVIRRAKEQAFVQRVVMGLFGGLSLIGPVLIMVLHPSRNTDLITVSIATILFATILAIGAMDSNGKDVLAAVAAYTAVLVVFLGTSSS